MKNAANSVIGKVLVGHTHYFGWLLPALIDIYLLATEIIQGLLTSSWYFPQSPLMARYLQSAVTVAYPSDSV